MGKELTQTGAAQGKRRLHAMAYEAARKRTVLYGGVGPTMNTWEWDGRQRTQIH
jgi:hypothetical protein